MYGSYNCLNGLFFGPACRNDEERVLEVVISYSYLIYARALLEYVIFVIYGCVLLPRCYRPWNLRKMRCSLSLSSVKKS